LSYKLIYDYYHYNKIIKNINNINGNFNNKTKLCYNNPNIHKNINHDDTNKINKLESIYYYDYNTNKNVNDTNEIKSTFNNYKPGENVFVDGNIVVSMHYVMY